MFGPIGLGISSAHAMTAVVCPHCRAPNARSRWTSGLVTCKACHKRFDVAAAARRKAPAVRRRG
ncbi:MAG: hypothetical protein K8W52_47195 [Deltaproteobacteria bacterium]|nr:hypothetical protein [Deltaproteobacteria bacterium]